MAYNTLPASKLPLSIVFINISRVPHSLLTRTAGYAFHYPAVPLPLPYIAIAAFSCDGFDYRRRHFGLSRARP